MVNTWSGRSGVLDVMIKQWSTAEQAQALQAAVDDQGNEQVVKLLGKMPQLGYLQVPGELGLDLHFTRVMPGPENTRQILALTDRWLHVREMMNDSITTDYPLTVVQLVIKPNGDGTGVVMPMVRINYWDPRTQLLFLDNFTMEPLQLPTVKLQLDHKKDKKDKKDKKK